jgi:hypothetical protein
MTSPSSPNSEFVRTGFQLEDDLIAQTEEEENLRKRVDEAEKKVDRFHARHGSPSGPGKALLVIGAIVAAYVVDVVFVRAALEFFAADFVAPRAATILSYVIPLAIVVLEVYVGWRRAEALLHRLENERQRHARATIAPLSEARPPRGISLWDLLAALLALGTPVALAYTFILTHDQILWPFLTYLFVVALVAHTVTVFGAGLLVALAQEHWLERAADRLQRDLAELYTRVRLTVVRLLRVQQMRRADGHDVSITDLPSATREMVGRAFGPSIISPPVDGMPQDGPTPHVPPPALPPGGHDGLADDLAPSSANGGDAGRTPVLRPARTSQHAESPAEEGARRDPKDADSSRAHGEEAGGVATC